MADKLKIYVAGYRGMVGSALVRTINEQGSACIVTRTHSELDLTDQAVVRRFFELEQPDQERTELAILSWTV